MSVTYHAYQNRNFRFNDYEAISQQWRDAFSGYDPSRIARILHLDFNDRYLYIVYFGQRYRLSLFLGTLEKEREDGTWDNDLMFNESMVIYHLLTYTADHPAVSGSWVSFEALDGVVSRRNRGGDPILDPFSAHFAGRVSALSAACRTLARETGGEQIEKGDIAYRFIVFPQVSLQFVFWDRDDDFPAQTQIFADSRVTDFIHYETLGCVISDLLEKITAAEPDQPGRGGSE